MVDNAADGQMKIEFKGTGRKAKCPPNPAYPQGIDLDMSAGALTACKTTLPYPAREVGGFAVECRLCGMTAYITAAGRPDDPRSLILACKNTNSTSARH